MKVFLLKVLDFAVQAKTSPEEHRVISNTAHELVLWAVSYFYNIPSDVISIEKLEGGKPVINGADDIHISISHSGAYAVCAVGNDCVGVDVEMLRQRNTGVMRKMFSADEIEQVESSDDADRMYTELWTVKEAFGKYHGTGLFGGVSLKDAAKQCYETDLSFKSFWIDDHCCSVVSKDDVFEIYNICKTHDGFEII